MSISTPIRIENITPILNVKDISVSRQFYVELLGFRESEWGNDDFTCMVKDSAAIYFCHGTQGCKGTWLWVGFDGDIFSLHEELKARGVTIRRPPQNYSWALEMHVEDPDGHILRFGTEPDKEQPYLDQEKTVSF